LLSVGRWVAKVSKVVARLLAMAALWVQIETSIKKYKMGDISKRVAKKTFLGDLTSKWSLTFTVHPSIVYISDDIYATFCSFYRRVNGRC
jgi:hypothetical protein